MYLQLVFVKAGMMWLANFADVKPEIHLKLFNRFQL